MKLSKKHRNMHLFYLVLHSSIDLLIHAVEFRFFLILWLEDISSSFSFCMKSNNKSVCLLWDLIRCRRMHSNSIPFYSMTLVRNNHSNWLCNIQSSVQHRHTSTRVCIFISPIFPIVSRGKYLFLLIDVSPSNELVHVSIRFSLLDRITSSQVFN